MKKLSYLLLIITICLLLLEPCFMQAQQANKSGVSPNTISLPSGPGSIEGLGESFEPNLNTGQVSYGVELQMPPGTAGHTPSLKLSYNGGNGNSIFGYGWMMSLPYIQRQSDKGIPRYIDEANGIDDDGDGQSDEADELDVFINENKEELVRIDNGYYFCENEAAFVRYRRVGQHWEAHLPNGNKMEFGLTENGRVTHAATGQIYSWLIEKITDTNGNVIVFKYAVTPTEDCQSNGSQRYLSNISYGAGAPPWSHFHFVQFQYESRHDWFEDNRAGFPIRTNVRIKQIDIATQGIALAGHLASDTNEDGITDYLNRSYRLSYNTASYWSLLQNVVWVGADGMRTYPPLSFEYSNNTPEESISALGQVIGESNAPFQLMDSPLVDLIDLNGDALPDLLKTEQFGGTHIAYFNQGEQIVNNQRVIVWDNPQQMGSEDGIAYSVDLQNDQNIAHLADMDADGLSDLVYKAAFGEVYYFKNKGNTEWGSRQLMNNAAGVSAPPSPFGSTSGVKTADLDFDKNIDVIQSISVGNGFHYRIWFNLGNQQYAQPVTVAPFIGYDLSASNVKISDFNGDRIADIIQIRPTGIYVTAGLGYGNFSTPFFVPLPDFVLSNEQIETASLQDINGDGLSDLMLDRPHPNQIWYWLNQANYSLDDRRLITDLPSVQSTNFTVRWADMNGNGTTDYVIADPSAQPRLQIIDIGELIGAVPAPNLLTKIDNGIGKKIHFDYGTSTTYLLADRMAGDPWTDPLPFVLQVLSKVTTEDGMGETYESNFFYHKGYYDGDEKEFRGFAMVESQDVGDDSTPDLWTAYEFDTGVIDKSLKGKQLSIETRSATNEIFFKEEQQWQSKVLHTSANDDGRTVTFPYPDTKTRDVIEKGNGTPVQLQWAFDYDDYGNLIEATEYGRTDAGWGDERVNKIQYTSAYPDGQARWIINKIVEQSIHKLNDDRIAQTKMYYDGFSDLGAISRGNDTRTEQWIQNNEYSNNRIDYDVYGNPIAIYDPLYTDAMSGHYRELEYDRHFHTFLEKEVIYTGKANPASLVYQAGYDYGFGVVTSSTEYNGHGTSYEYDEFTRLTGMTKPLDNQVTVEYDYVLAQTYGEDKTLNWIETRHLDHSTGNGYLHSRTYSDGLGRKIMTRSEGEEAGQIVVNETVQFNKRKQPRKEYLPYFETGTLDFVAPTFNTGFTEQFYDALGRPIRTNQPIGVEGIVFSKMEYGPLSVFTQDEEQTNPASPHFGCGTRTVQDGLQEQDGKNRMREKYELVKLSDLGETIGNIVEWKSTFDYDLLDNLTHHTDAQNNEKIMNYDGLSRRTFINDPNQGQSHFSYDAANNLIQIVDAKNQTVRYDYDGINRPLAEYYSATSQAADVKYHYDTPFGAVSQGDFWTNPASTVTAQNTLGHLSWIEDQSGEEHNAYDERGRVQWVIKRLKETGATDFQNFYTEYAYDAMDRITQLTYPDASTISYGYNSRGLLETVPNFINQYDYNPAGQNSLLNLNCGTSTVHEYDHRLRLSRIHTLRTNDQIALQDLNYSFDGLSNITAISDGRSDAHLEAIGVELGLGTTEARKYKATQSFIYDNLYRLKQASNPAVYGTIDYRYDRLGNMVQKDANLLNPMAKMDLGTMSSGGNAGTWGRIGRNAGEAPGPGAITSTEHDGHTFTYDDNGNMLTDKTANFNWDFKNRLTSTTTNGTTAAYQYDYTNTRKIRQVDETLTVYYINQFAEARNGDLIKYVYAGNHRVAQVKPSNNQTTFFLQDHLGTTALSLNETGTVKEQSIKYPFGLTRKRNSTGFQADYTFTGKEKDGETDNFYFEARYYNPMVGRFLSFDPLSEKYPSLSPYAYVANNPLKYVDPNGLEPEEKLISTKSTSKLIQKLTGLDKVKPEFVKDGASKLVDFGIKTVLDKVIKPAFKGTDGLEKIEAVINLVNDAAALYNNQKKLIEKSEELYKAIKGLGDSDNVFKNIKDIVTLSIDIGKIIQKTIKVIKSFDPEKEKPDKEEKDKPKDESKKETSFFEDILKILE